MKFYKRTILNRKEVRNIKNADIIETDGTEKECSVVHSILKSKRLLYIKGPMEGKDFYINKKRKEYITI